MAYWRMIDEQKKEIIFISRKIIFVKNALRGESINGIVEPDEKQLYFVTRWS